MSAPEDIFGSQNDQQVGPDLGSPVSVPVQQPTQGTADQPTGNSNYMNVGLDTPDDAFKVMTKISTFGEQHGAGTDPGDAGGFAFGGRSTDNPEYYAAIDPAWYKQGIKPGSTVNVINPRTGQTVPVVLRDKGPARWTGRGIDVAPDALKALGMDTDEHAIVDFKPAIMSAGQEQAGADTEQAPDLTTPAGAQQALAQATAPGQDLQAATGQQSGAITDVTATSDKALQGVTKLPDGGYDLGGGMVGYKNGIIQMRTGNSITEYIPDPNSPNGIKTHTFTTKAATAKSGQELMFQEAAKKGVVREDYPEGPEGDKQFKQEAKLTLGAGVADDIAEAIMSGKQPPDTKGLYRTGPMVRAKLAQQGYDMKNANLDWQASQRFILSQNSPPLARLRMSANTAYDSLGVIDSLASQWKANAHLPALNRAHLAAAQNGLYGQDAASLARRLDGQITDLTFELGNVYMGGSTPTDQSLQLAKKNLSADWDEKVLHDMTNLARTNLQIRLNSFKSVEPAGLSEEAAKESRWKQTNPSATPAPAGSPPAQPQPVVGKNVNLKGVGVVKITKINPDGTFEYTTP